MIAPFPMRRWLERRPVVLAVAFAIYAAVFAVRQTSTDTSDTIALLYVVPIGLVALEFGFGWGIAAGLLALGLVGVWMVAANASLGVGGLLTRAVAFLAIGAVAGRFGDRMRDAQERQHRLLRSGLALAHLEHADDLQVTLAEQAEAVCPGHPARVDLSSGPTPHPGDRRMEPPEERLPIEVRGVRYGTLAVGTADSLTDEDRATLAILALQAAVAAENGKLLESERQRAAIQAQLQDARIHLAERAGQLREVLARQEAERDRVAYELHEQAAQTLAAVLLGLRGLERNLGFGNGSLGELRSDIDSTLQQLRSLAVSLRPTTLALGLQTALERLAENSIQRRVDQMTIMLGQLDELSPDTELMAYRGVEEALAAVGYAQSVSVRTDEERNELVIDIRGAGEEIAAERLTVLKARIELAGGTLAATSREVRARIPLRTSAADPEMAGA